MINIDKLLKTWFKQLEDSSIGDPNKYITYGKIIGFTTALRLNKKITEEKLQEYTYDANNLL